MTIPIPDPSLVLLIGPSGAGKSTFARRFFKATEILSSDYYRALVCDDENDQTATNDAFELLHLILAKRLARHRTTVIDATNVQPSSRSSLLAAAAQWKIPAVAIIFQLAEDICQQRNQERAKRQVPPEVITSQIAALSESAALLETEGFAAVYRLTDDAGNAVIIRHS
jgi:protein phosphatase